MSLINQMLRDLQARQAADKPGAAPPPEIEPEGPRRLPLPVYMIIVGACGVLLLWWLAGVMTGGVAPEAELAVQPGAVQVPPQSAIVPAGNTTGRENQKLSTSAPVAELAGLPEPARSPVPPEAETTRTAGPVEAVTTKMASQISEAASATEPALLGKPSRPAAVPAEKPAVATAARQPGRVLPENLPGAVTNRVVDAAGRGIYSSAEEGFQAAQKFYRKNRELSAMAALELTLRQDPGHLAAREFLADLYEMAGRFSEAVALLEQGTEIVPSHLMFKQRAARLLAGQGAFEEAAAVLLHGGLPKISQAPEIHALLAGYYMQLNEPFLAAQTYRNLLAVWPKVGSFWAGLGSALEEQGLKDDARDAYLQALAAGDLPDELTKVVAGKLQE